MVKNLNNRWNTKIMVLVLLASTILAAPLFAGQPPAGPPVITVTNNQVGITQQLVGIVEGNGGYDINDLTGLGVNNYRMYGGASRYETVDDDGVYGSPTIAEIKADPNVINWTAWADHFNRQDGYFWSLYANGAQVSSATMLAELKAAGIEVVMTVRPRDNHNTPAWLAAIPVYNTDDRNEWWEHVFAMVYYVNVLNDWQIDRWEVHNEPNQNGQGWADNGGTKEDYAEFVILTVDAIDYVYTTYLNDRTHYIHAPVLSGNPNRAKWTPYLLQTVDSYFDIFDYHWYSSNQDAIATGYHEDIAADNPDGYIEPLFNSEWGTYSSTYNTVSAALDYTQQLYKMNLPASYVMGSQIFSMYTWGTAEGLVDDYGVKSETYYALQTFIPAIQDGKASYEITGETGGLDLIASEAVDGTIYITAINRGDGSVDVQTDVSAHLLSGTASVYEYSAANKNALVATPTISAGILTFSSPIDSVVTVVIP